MPNPFMVPVASGINQSSTYRPTPAEQIPEPYIGSEETPTVPHADLSTNTEGYPGQVSNAPAASMWQTQLPPQRQTSGNVPSPTTAIPMHPHTQPPPYRPPHAYNYPLPQPIYFGPSVQLDQLQNYPMPVAVPSVNDQQQYPATYHSGQPGRRTGGERQGSGAYRDNAQHFQHRRRRPSSSGNQKQIAEDKLWVGNLTENDSIETLVAIFKPLGSYAMAPIRKSGSFKQRRSSDPDRGFNAHFTFVR